MADTVKVSLREIDDAILDGIEDNGELRRALDDFVDDIHTTWVNIWVASGPHPYSTGEYLAHIKKEKLSKWYRMHVRNYLKRHMGMPIGMVYNDSPIAHFVEYGTGPDKPGGHATWIGLDGVRRFGPNTPTPEYAPMRKTYARFLT
jgi:hypothetical protein